MAEMRRLLNSDRVRIQEIIDRNRQRLARSRGFLGARPGFWVEGGQLRREPSVMAYVRTKVANGDLSEEELVPEELEGVRVHAVVPGPVTQLELAAERGGLAPAVAPFTEPRYQGIDGDPIDNPFTVQNKILCHVGPDAGWRILRDFLEGTRRELTAAIYDFNAAYIADSLVACSNEHEFPIRLAIDNTFNASEKAIQQRLRDELDIRYDAEIIFCRATGRFPSAYHEKVAVRDGTAFWLSSGNWSRRSQPDIDPIRDPSTAPGMYGKGNREWHMVVEDEALARIFARYIEHDRSQAQSDALAELIVPAMSLPDLFVPIAEWVEEIQASALLAPAPVPPCALPSTGDEFVVRPVLSPDNYATRVTELIKGAKQRLYLQYAYINWPEAPQDKVFRELLEYLIQLSCRKDFDLKVIVDSRDAKEKVTLLCENGFNEGVFFKQGNVHNKGIVADGKRVLVSSQNWSGDGFLRNRDAGLIVDHPEIAAYYERVFLDDLNERTKPALEEGLTVLVAGEAESTPPGMMRMRWYDYYEN